MRVATSVTGFPDADLPEAANLAKRVGFEGLELFLHWGRALAGGMSAWPAQRVLQVFQNVGIDLCGLTGVCLSLAKGEEPAALISRVLREIEYAQSLGLRSLNVHGAGRSVQTIPDLVKILNGICDELPDGFTLNLENHVGSTVEGLRDLRQVFSSVHPSVHLLLDTGQFLAAREDPNAVAETFASCVGQVRLGDFADGRAVVLGCGDLRLTELLRTLHQSRYVGWIVVALQGEGTVEEAEGPQRDAYAFVRDRLAEFTAGH